MGKPLIHLIFFSILFNTNLKGQSITLSKIKNLVENSDISYIGENGQYHYYITSKQSFYDYAIIILDKNNFKNYEKRLIIFKNKFEMINRFVYNFDTLYIETKNEIDKSKYYKINFKNFNLINILENEFLNNYDNDLNKFIFYKNRIFKINNSFPSFDRNKNNKIYSNDTFYSEHYTELNYLDSIFKYRISNLTIGLTGKSLVKEIEIGKNKEIVKYDIFYTNNQFKVIGIYKEFSNKTPYYGLFYKVYDKNLEPLKDPSFIYLCQGDSITQNLFNSNLFKLFNSNLEETEKYLSNDGEITFVFSNINTNTANFRNGEYIRLIDRSLNNITIFTFNNLGEIKTTEIFINQKTNKYFNSLGYSCYLSGNVLNILFFDHPKNLSRYNTGKKNKSFIFGSKGVLVNYKYSLLQKKIVQTETISKKSNFKDYFSLNNPIKKIKLIFTKLIL